MYSSVTWKRLLVALLIASIPAFLLEQSQPRLAGRYVTVILLGMVLYQSPGLIRFASYLISLIGR